MNCNFCGNRMVSVKRVKGYLLCIQCGCYSRIAGDGQTFMINERLDLIGAPDILSNKLLEIVLRHRSRDDMGLIDFGCGGGKFLLGATTHFPRVAGVEITPASIAAAESQGVKIFSEVPLNDFGIATFWHSLEHLPFQTLKNTLDTISKSEIEMVFVSVPNAMSITMRLFGDYDAFYDEQNHTFIFSKKIICELFRQIGFIPMYSPRNRYYSYFGIVQSPINFLTRTRNQVYLVLKRGVSFRDLSIFRHLVISPLVIPLALLTFLISTLRRDRDPVLNLIFTRNE